MTTRNTLLDEPDNRRLDPQDVPVHGLVRSYPPEQ